MNGTELVNAVLRRLREDEVSDVNTNAYSKLVLDFVNEAKREVEDAWNWNTLLTTIQVTTVAGSARYELTNAGVRYRTASVYNQTDKNYLLRKPHVEMTDLLLGSADTGSPRYYDYNDTNDLTGQPYTDIYPIPDGEYLINYNLYIPSPDFTLGTEILQVPNTPVILGAYAKAIAERGEDQGRTHGEVIQAYTLALGDAIAIDNSNTIGEDTWHYV